MDVDRSAGDRLRRQLERWRDRTPTVLSPSASTESVPSFRSQLRRKQAEKLEAELETLLERLDRRAETLLERPSMRRLERYRGTLAAILDRTLSLARRTKRLTGRRAFPSAAGSSTKEHVIVSRVDETMDALAAWIRRNERERMRVMEELGELKGLLLDVFDRVRPST